MKFYHEYRRMHLLRFSKSDDNFMSNAKKAWAHMSAEDKALYATDSQIEKYRLAKLEKAEQ
jgi:hypothetical protein